MAVEEITVEVATPKGMFSGSFPKTAKVKDVIDAAVASLGIDSSESLELVRNGEVLQPIERTLISFGLSGRVQLDLVATGSGV